VEKVMRLGKDKTRLLLRRALAKLHSDRGLVDLISQS